MKLGFLCGLELVFSLSQHAIFLGRWAWKFEYVQTITKTRLFKYIENFTTKKNENFQIKNSYILHISDQNIDCGYSLELPPWGSSNEYPQSKFLAEIRKIMYTPVNPSFTI